MSKNGGSGPVDSASRVAELDVLRGMALYGVFLMNMLGFAGEGLMATEQQLLSLPTAAMDGVVWQLTHWLVVDKANTLFAFLFGLGFYLQMQRLESRGVDFRRIYLRRLTVLLGFGVLHNFLLFSWDILNTYALAGFALFALRHARDRMLLWGGLLLAMFSLTLHGWLSEALPLDTWHGRPSPFTVEAVLVRQAVSADGDYWGLVRLFADYTLVDYILNGLIAGWVLYALGRFMLGAWVGRKGWLQDAGSFLPGFRQTLRITLPIGLLGEGVASIVQYYAETDRLVASDYWINGAKALHMLAVPVLAAAYVCLVVLALHHRRFARWLHPFANAGRMALTNYLSQSILIGLLLFKVAPGLGLAGHLGSSVLLAIVTGLYGLQLVASGWWLSRFRQGPMEWVWRRLTYA